jgi:glycosyltransferase involved in cell wall biosynthesis
MTVFGLLRIKNEARWIVDVLLSILPLCERIFVLDDHSEDGTAELCEKLGDRVIVIRSQFDGLDERRDKDVLLTKAMEHVPSVHLEEDGRSPYWAIVIDGDELLDPVGADVIGRHLPTTASHAFRLPVRYLWDSDLKTYPMRKQIRVDGVYRNFARPSIFRLFSRGFRFQTTPAAGNLHCSSIPEQLLHQAQETLDAPLWHLGYNDRADRLRKYRWYNSVDPGNVLEDGYRHCVQGDVAEVPADARLRHAGPLELVTVATTEVSCSAA